MLNPVELQGQIGGVLSGLRIPHGRRLKANRSILALSIGVEPIASPFGGVRSVH